MYSDQRGLFVYEVLQRVRPGEFPGSGGGAASFPAAAAASSSSSASRGFHRGDLVSVDVIRRGYVDRHMNDVAYLRLSDGSGLWIPESVSFVGGASAVALVRRVPVEAGLWTLHVDNCPLGQSLRHHPLDSPHTIVRRSDYVEPTVTAAKSRHEDDGDEAGGTSRDDPQGEEQQDHPTVFYETMQKVYCDRKVVSPATLVAFYRVQGANKWLMDRRLARSPDAGAVAAGRAPAVLLTPMLVDASFVRTGTFCFQAVQNLLVRSRGTVGDGAGTPHKVKKGSLVSVDTIREGPDKLNGPFLRLSDGSGWLFVQKNGATMMRQIPVQPGAWELEVLAPPGGGGLALQRHPVEGGGPEGRGDGDDASSYLRHTFPAGSVVQATARVRVLNPGHDSTFHEPFAEDQPHSFVFYKVYGTRGWLADRHRSGKRALKVLTEDAETMASLGSEGRGGGAHGDDGGDGGCGGWTVDYVRGVASTVPNLREVHCAPGSCNPVLEFKMGLMSSPRAAASEDDGIRRVVCCATRTVGILFEPRRRLGQGQEEDEAEDRNDRGDGDDADAASAGEPLAPARWYRHCTAKDLREHLRMDAVEIMMSPGADDDDDDDDGVPANGGKKSVKAPLEADRASSRAEEALRRELLALDAKIERASAQRAEMIEKLRGYDRRRFEEAQEMRELMDERREAYRTPPTEKREDPKDGVTEKDAKPLDVLTGGGAGAEARNSEPNPAHLPRSTSADDASESSTESIADSKWKKSRCRSADAASPLLPSALSTSPRSRRVQHCTSADRVTWKDESSNNSSSRPRRAGKAAGDKSCARRPSSPERESFRNRIEGLLLMRSAEAEPRDRSGGGGAASSILRILSGSNDDDDEEEDSNTLVSGSGQSYESTTDEGSTEYDSY
jgi:hypothetical protein